jgi:hypothetical protein
MEDAVSRPVVLTILTALEAGILKKEPALVLWMIQMLPV